MIPPSAGESTLIRGRQAAAAGLGIANVFEPPAQPAAQNKKEWRSHSFFYVDYFLTVNHLMIFLTHRAVSGREPSSTTMETIRWTIQVWPVCRMGVVR